MPMSITQPEPEPSPTPIPVKSAFQVTRTKILQYNENNSVDNSAYLDDPITFQIMLDNNAAIASILNDFSNES